MAKQTCRPHLCGLRRYWELSLDCKKKKNQVMYIIYHISSTFTIRGWVLSPDLRSPSAALMACLFRKVLRSFSLVCFDSRAISSFLCLLMACGTHILYSLIYTSLIYTKTTHLVLPSKELYIENGFPWHSLSFHGYGQRLTQARPSESF